MPAYTGNVHSFSQPRGADGRSRQGSTSACAAIDGVGKAANPR